MLTAPKLDLSTSNFTIRAAQLRESARDILQKAHHVFADGRIALAEDLFQQAAGCYADAGQALIEHAEYVRNELEKCNEPQDQHERSAVHGTAACEG